MASGLGKQRSVAVGFWQDAGPKAASACPPKVSPGRTLRWGLRIETIKQRRDFIAVRGGYRAPTEAFLVEAKARGKCLSSGPDTARFGFTVTKKLGNAVSRNFIRRRLKHAVRIAITETVPPPLDFVVVARHAAISIPFTRLLDDMRTALVRVSEQSANGPPKPGRSRNRRQRKESETTRT